eukprot:TRINITY_DN385_c1_g1_i1.p2 TRINITY_DN385_c1_g1~~TRINITY_DN385_c1_g1_i1.p2  ORF type:complete len:118 (-),score=5.85 TRINITY_DN385_c1_g1_i1:647-1000(-)
MIGIGHTRTIEQFCHFLDNPLSFAFLGLGFGRPRAAKEMRELRSPATPAFNDQWDCLESFRPIPLPFPRGAHLPFRHSHKLHAIILFFNEISNKRFSRRRRNQRRYREREREERRQH